MEENNDNFLHLDMLINKSKRKINKNSNKVECTTLKNLLSNFYDHSMKNTYITDNLPIFCEYVAKKLDKIIPNYEKKNLGKLD
jgi:hypothetical protein